MKKSWRAGLSDMLEKIINQSKNPGFAAHLQPEARVKKFSIKEKIHCS